LRNRRAAGNLAADRKDQEREQFFEGSNDREFFVALSGSGRGCPVSRIELAQRAVHELRAIITQSA